MESRQLTLFAEDIPASLSPRPGSDGARKMGEATAEHEDAPHDRWPIRDEWLHNARAALAKVLAE